MVHIGMRGNLHDKPSRRERKDQEIELAIDALVSRKLDVLVCRVVDQRLGMPLGRLDEALSAVASGLRRRMDTALVEIEARVEGRVGDTVAGFVDDLGEELDEHIADVKAGVARLDNTVNELAGLGIAGVDTMQAIHETTAELAAQFKALMITKTDGWT